MLAEDTTWSPQLAILNIEKKDAACPEERSIAALPPSNAQIFAATVSQVGFCKRE